jgi:hypothetical protein
MYYWRPTPEMTYEPNLIFGEKVESLAEFVTTSFVTSEC